MPAHATYFPSGVLPAKYTPKLGLWPTKLGWYVLVKRSYSSVLVVDVSLMVNKGLSIVGMLRRGVSVDAHALPLRGAGWIAGKRVTCVWNVHTHGHTCRTKENSKCADIRAHSPIWCLCAVAPGTRRATTDPQPRPRA